MTTHRKGFTLVEIMIVVAIIGLLAAIAVPNLIRARETTRLNKCMNNARLIMDAVDQWALETNQIGSAVPTTTDILPYLKGNVLPVCRAGEDAYSLEGSFVTNVIVTCFDEAHGENGRWTAAGLVR